MTWIEALILGIVQGLTEFLPVSSTGHLVISSSMMGIQHEDFTKLFTVCIQLGSILSVLVIYWKNFIQSTSFYFKLFIAFIPSAICGLLFSSQIDSLLESPLTVGVMLVLGGIFFLFIDKIFKPSVSDSEESPTYMKAFKIGFFQCLALIPGVSRSAATIVGGLSQKLTRKAAAEFSFFLAVPTMFAATAKKLYDYYSTGVTTLDTHQIQILAFGNVVSFIVAVLAIKIFISYLTKHGFKLFGYYRIVVGIVIISLVLSGYGLAI